jgi:pseudouridine kinase
MDIKCRIAGRAAMASSNPGSVLSAPGGVARNIAEALARLGLAASLISAVGRDPPGRQLLAATAAAGVDVRGVLRGPAPTGIYAATLDARGELLVGVAAMGILERLTPRRLAHRQRLIAAADLVVADSNLPAATLDWLLAFAARRGLRLAIDAVSVPKARRLKPLLRARRPLFALFCNRAEAAALTGAADPRTAARRLHARGVRHVCIGLGRRGALASSAGAQQRVPTLAGDVVDVTGAGDAMVAGTLFGLLNGESLATAARYGQAAATLTRAGAQSVSPRLSARAIARCIRRGRPSP